MIRINTSTGETFSLNMEDEEQAKKIIRLLGDYNFQQTITGITLMRRYKRRHRCNCKRPANLVCPVCGTIKDDGYFNYTGNQYTLARPDSFDKISFAIENTVNDGDNGITGGEKLICNAGNIQLQIMTYAKQPSARVSLREIGKQRYNPNVR